MTGSGISRYRRWLVSAIFISLTSALSAQVVSILHIVNDSDYPLAQIHTARSDQDSWSENRLSNGPLASGERMELRLRPGSYWLLARFALGSDYVDVEDSAFFKLGGEYEWRISNDMVSVYAGDTDYDDTYGYWDATYGYYDDTYGYWDSSYGYYDSYGYYGE